MVVLRSGKVLNAEMTHRRLASNTHRRRITSDVPVYGRVMQQRGRQTQATMRRGPDRFNEPLNQVPLPAAPASPSMPPLDPPTGRRGIEEAFPDFQRGPLPRLSTQVPSRYHRENDMTCDCRDYPSLSLLGYTPLCIHRMIDPMSPRYAQYLPQDYTMYEGERGSDAVPLERCDPTHAPRTAYPYKGEAPRSDDWPIASLYKGEPEDDEPDVVLRKRESEDDDSDLELTAWTGNRAPLSQLLLNPPFSIAN